jgi:hypothetical protein
MGLVKIQNILDSRLSGPGESESNKERVVSEDKNYLLYLLKV